VKRFFFLAILWLFVVNIIYSQMLEGGVWQWQNPPSINISSLITFKSGSISNSTTDLLTNQSNKVSGTYKHSGSSLLVTIDNTKYNYSISWINKNKLILSDGENKLICAKVGTTDDTYFQRYMAWYIGGGSYGGSNSTPSKSEICYTCRGIGRCIVCEGMGKWKNSFAPFEWHECSACEGTGKCWHCYGSGKQ